MIVFEIGTENLSENGNKFYGIQGKKTGKYTFCLLF